MKKIARPGSISKAKLFVLITLLWSTNFGASAQSFTTPGAYSVTVPVGSTTMAVTVAGASGATAGAYAGGTGQVVTATYAVTAGTTYYIYVGAQGSTSPT